MKPAKSVPPLPLEAGAADAGGGGGPLSPRQPASAASRRSISALAPIGFGMKSVAPAFIAATAVVSEPEMLVAIRGYSPAAKPVSRAAPPIVSISAMTIARLSPCRAASASASLAQACGRNRPSARSAIMPASVLRWLASASTMNTSTGCGLRPKAISLKRRRPPISLGSVSFVAD